MAVTNCEELSNIISLGIISGDDDLAKEIARLSADKKDALIRAGKLKDDDDLDALTGYSAHVLELKASSADIQMRAIVQAKILSGDLMGVRGADAYRELAEQITKEGGTMAGGVELLNKLTNASPVDYENIAKQWGGAYADNPAQAVVEMKQAISENISANYSIRQYSEIKSKAMEKLRSQLRKGEITQGVFDDEVKKLHKEAMEQIAKGENPNKFAKLDEEWDAIKKVFGDDPTAKGKAWSQFIMARELLSDGGIDDGVLAAFKDMGAENLTGALTKDQIAEYGAGDLDKLLARAYTNTEQLYKDGELRQLYRDKLVELTTGMRVSKENLSKAKSIMQTMEFAEKGATFSDVVTADNAYRSATKRGIKVRDGNQLIYGIKKFAEKMGENPDILKEPIKIAGAEFKPIDLIQVIYDITQDENILKLLRIGFFSDGTVLSVATSSLLGGTKEAADRILRLFSKAKEAPKVSNIRDTSLKAICGDEIKGGAPMGFFDFRKSLYQKDELNRPKADFFDKLAEKNKMRVDSTDIKEIKNTDDVNTLVEELQKYKGGYVIVNDSQWRANSTFSEAFDLVNKDLKDEEKITALFPRGGLSSNFTMENGQLFFRTLYDDIYRDVAGTISIQTLGEARPTREILATAYEAATGKNGDWILVDGAMKKGGKDDFFQKGNDYIDITKSTDEIREEYGYATLYDVIKNKWYDDKLSILGGKLKTDRVGIKESYKAYKKVKIKGNEIPTIKMYRAADPLTDVLSEGDYITPSKSFAEQMNKDIYGGKGKIIEVEIPINKIWLRKDKTIEEGCYFYTKKEVDDAMAAKLTKSVNATESMMKYNNEVDAAAVKYFGEMLGVNRPNIIDKEYIDKVQNMLSERLGIDMKTFEQMTDRSALWQKVDEKFTLERFTTGRYDRQVVDINAEKNKIAGYTDEQLEREIKNDLGDILIRGNIKGNKDIAHIREAYLDYKLAPNAVDSLAAKGKIISLANGGTAKTMSMQQIRDMFTNGTFDKVYKEMFFPNQTLTDKEMKQFIDAINNNIFDTLSIQFAENLVDAGYSLPLMNIRSFVYEYLRGTLDLNNKFVESFLYKNKIPYTADGLKSIVDTLMPTEFRFDYEKALFKGRLGEMEQGSVSTVREIKNRFLPESYSAIAAVEMAKGADIGLNYEKDILEGILDKYVNAVLDGVKAGTLDFQGAQGLKQEAGYALDMFEQDYLLPRYGKFLSKQERQGITNLKSLLPIGVKGQNVDRLREELISIRTKINQRYSMTLSNAAKNNDINMSILRGLKGADEKMQKAIDERRQQLIDSGGVIKEVNGQYLVYDVKQALAWTIAQLPQNIGGLEGIKALGRAGIEGLTNKQAYAILRYLEAAKGLSATANLATDLIYKLNPRLLQYNFFQSYKVGKQGMPIALEGNLLNMDKFLSKFDNISGLDNIAKKNIFEGIVNKFRQQSYLTTQDLDGIITDGVKEAQASFRQIQFSAKDAREAADRMALVYRKVFEPYVHVKDIPKGGVLIDGITPVRDVKKKVENAMKQQYNQAVKDLEAVGIEDMNSLQTAIYITTNDGEKISLKKAGEMNIDSWKKNIFNDEGIFIAGADDLKKFEGSPDDKAKVAEQKDWRNGIISEYDSALSSLLSQTEYISKAERDLTTAFMNDARTSMRQYTLTNKIVDALDSLSGLNEEAARGIKDYLIGWKGNISFGKWKPKQILDRNELVKNAYREYYAMDLTKLNSVSPTSRAEDLALRLAKYFKNLERLLGSADGLTGCTTSETLNRAFFHIGEVVMNVDTVKGVFGLLSGVEQNQILKFFKFARGQLAKDADVFIRRGKGNFQESLGGYRDYVEEISGISRDTFNEIFASNFSEGDFKRILQGLTGFTLTGSWGRKATQILNLLNGSNFLFRFLMSYPGQLLTIPQQSLAYFLKQIGFERQLGVESMSDVDAVRMHYGVLDGAYNELVMRGKSTVSPDDLRLDSYYNRYGIPDVDEIYKTSSIETADDYINMYAKIDNHAASSISATNKWLRQLDPYKDNANNIIDGLFARNFKNISFLKAIRGNDFLQFGSAKEFMSFMDDPRISAEVKTRLMDRVSAYSGRNFRNILGLGFGGIDRAIAGSGFGNIMYGLMQLFNFRGSWGQNIFKQTGANFFTALKMLTTSKGAWSREGREALAEYIARQPEFTNFVGALFNDLRWTWKLQRFQDNGRWPDDEDFYDAMDFIEYMTDTLNMTSQWFQGLQSFGPFRPIREGGVSIFNSHMNPTIYKDTFGVGAFFNALGKNFGRQWKPYNWIAKWVGAWTTGGPSEAMAYLESEWRKLSFGSLRYMVNEDQNAYGYTYEMTGQTGGIPSILMGESRLGSDKNFSYEIDNTETWETIGQIFNGDIPWDSRWTYIGNLGKAFVNGSQLAALPRSVYRAYKRTSPSYSTANDLAEYMQKSEAGLEFYQKGIVTPKTPEEAEIFFNTLLANAKYRPGSSSFTKSLIQYEDYGHMDGKNGKKADAEMELWLSHMKYLTNEHGEFETHGGEKVIDPSWTKLIEDVKIHGYNETYTTNLIYNYAKTWLNNHSADPNYQLYVKMLGQGQAHNLIEYKTNQVLEVLNAGKKGKDNKWTKTELEDVGLDIDLLLQLGNSKIEGEDVTLFDKLQVLDEDNATVAALQIIQSQLGGEDRKKLDKFFEVEEQDDGSKVISLKYQYENTLKQIGAVAKAIDDGDADLAVAEASTLVNMYKSKDPTGAVTASLIDSIYNRIYDTNSFTPEQKQAAMIALFHKNKEYIQRNPEKLREKMGDDYDVYADYMNQMLYQRDGMTISNLESMQSSGESSSKSSRAAADFSSALKSLSNSIGGSGGNRGTGSTATYKEWVPVVIKGANLVQELGLKGYTPTVKNLKVNSYKPHLDLSPKKDINRNVKGPTTEAISTKKQLSNLVSKTTKALEAES